MSRIGSICLLVFAVSLLQAEPLKVAVSVLPLESIVREIGGDAVEVRSLQREGDSCSVFEPRPSAVAWLAEAEIFFRTGVGYETVVMEKIRRQFANLKVEDLREAVPLLSYDGHSHHGHDHGGHDCAACAAHDHGEAATDPHIWLDPVRLAAMAAWIGERLAEARPEQAGLFHEGAARFQQRAAGVHASLEAELAPYHGKSFYIYHPALNYFAARYGLRQIAIAGPVQGPTARELHRITAEARDSGVRAVFVQPQESRKHAEVVAAAIGAQLVEIDPMATDWEANLRRIGAAIAGALSSE